MMSSSSMSSFTFSRIKFLRDGKGHMDRWLLNNWAGRRTSFQLVSFLFFSANPVIVSLRTRLVNDESTDL